MNEPSFGSPNDDENIIETSTTSTSSRRRTRSKVWEHFKKVKLDSGEEKAVCKYCKKQYTGGTTKGTSHLLGHIPRCPKMKENGTNEPMTLRLEGATSMLCLENSKFDQDRSQMDLARMIMKHGYPLDMVEHEFFQIFVNNLQPSFRLVSKNTIRNDVMKVFSEERDRLYKYFDRLSCRISLNIDMWTSDQNLGYYCLTAHFIDDGWGLKKKIIAFTAVECPHDGNTLYKIVMERLLSWNLDKKICSITVTNASNNDIMVRELRNKLCSQSLLPLDGEVFHVRCIAHTLNLTVQDGLHEISSLLYKIRESAKYVRLTQQKKQNFDNAKSQVKLQHKKEVVVDCSTQWNSTYDMLESALELREAFFQLAETDHDYKYCPSNEEWEMGKVIRDCLKVFYICTKNFSSINFPTASILFSDICTIKLRLHMWQNSEYQYVRSMAYKMKQKFDKYWDECCLVLAIAVVLDPRFKMEVVTYYYNLIYGENAERHIMRVRLALNDLYLEYVGNDVGKKSLEDSSSAFPSQRDHDPDDFLSGFDKWLVQERSNYCFGSRKSELDLYLEERLFPRDEDFDILRFWQVDCPKFPKLSRLARDILAIPILTVTSEATFSTKSRIVDQYHTSLLPEIVEALVCGKDWLEAPTKRNLDFEAIDASPICVAFTADTSQTCSVREAT
ncbi:PREDICTED: zinc finger BED domain-containing protein RICESLEEPER 2-like isoform X2 [Nelumbo nucifera]|nr:PREDICTED: zinc finger BED domain-containing protein RICESLEEPER 2-like isoform X2 [Nelumbo nucifera]